MGIEERETRDEEERCYEPEGVGMRDWFGGDRFLFPSLHPAELYLPILATLETSILSSRNRFFV